jgi:hypothetical protein
VEEVVASLLFESGELVGSVTVTLRAAVGALTGSFTAPAGVKLLIGDRFRLITANSRVGTIEVASVRGDRIEFQGTTT